MTYETLAYSFSRPGRSRGRRRALRATYQSRRKQHWRQVKRGLFTLTDGVRRWTPIVKNPTSANRTSTPYSYVFDDVKPGKKNSDSYVRSYETALVPYREPLKRTSVRNDAFVLSTPGLITPVNTGRSSTKAKYKRSKSDRKLGDRLKSLHPKSLFTQSNNTPNAFTRRELAEIAKRRTITNATRRRLYHPNEVQPTPIGPFPEPIDYLEQGDTKRQRIRNPANVRKEFKQEFEAARGRRRSDRLEKRETTTGRVPILPSARLAKAAGWKVQMMSRSKPIGPYNLYEPLVSAGRKLKDDDISL